MGSSPVVLISTRSAWADLVRAADRVRMLAYMDDEPRAADWPDV